MAAERYDGAGPVNLGTAEEVCVRDLAETIARTTLPEGLAATIQWYRQAQRA